MTIPGISKPMLCIGVFVFRTSQYVAIAFLATWDDVVLVLSAEV